MQRRPIAADSRTLRTAMKSEPQIRESQALSWGAVGKALQSRSPLTNEEFGRRFYEPAISPLATRLRRMPVEGFSEAMAITCVNPRRAAWPKRFGSIELLVRWVTNYWATPPWTLRLH